jgi:thiamine kinase-like enzyme
LLPATQVEHMLGERDVLLASVRSLPATAQHGDAHPGNVLLTEQGVVWNDFEDCCLASPLWDLATLARHDQTGAVWAVARDRFGGDVVEAMLGLRLLQVAAWTALHGAHAAGRL